MPDWTDHKKPPRFPKGGGGFQPTPAISGYASALDFLRIQPKPANPNPNRARLVGSGIGSGAAWA